MTQIITTDDTIHIQANTDAPDWQTDHAHCGHTGVSRDLTPAAAARHNGNICQHCKQAADEETTMAILEAADEALTA